MQAIPLHIKEANAFVAKYHGHILRAVGGKLVVVVIAGGPVARRLDDAVFKALGLQ